MSKSNNLESWATATIPQLLSSDGLISDGDWIESKDQDANGSVRLIQLADVGDGVFLNKSNRFMTHDRAAALRCTYLKKGDVLVARMPEPLGRACVFPGVDMDSVTVVDICLIRTSENSAIFNRLLKYWINAPQVRTEIEANSSGTTRKRITRKKLELIALPVPSRIEQKVIAEKLDDMLAKVERIKARLERIPQILKKFRQSVLADAISGELTGEWRQNSEFSLSLARYKKATASFKSKANGLKGVEEVGKWISCQLGHVISVKSGDGLTAKEMIGDGGIAVYGGNGINGYHDKFNVTEQKVVIGRVGFYCGSVHLTQEKAWITDNALIVDYPEQLFSKDFIFWLLSTINLREDMAATAQPVISGAKIYPIKLLIPPIEEQIEIARRVRELFSFADIVEQKTNFALEKVGGLSQSILAKAFRGELTEQWRLENPELIIGENSAESLLKKILNERDLIKKLPKTRADNVKKKTIMNKITKQEINNWVASRNGAPFTFEQLKASFNCDYEQLKESLFEALCDDDAVFKQSFDETTGFIQFVGVSR